MKVTYEFDPFEIAGIEPPKSSKRRKEALEEIAEFVKTEALSYIGEGKSPVSNGAWKRTLSKEYKARKMAESGVGYANMELSGDMLDSLESEVVKGTKIVFGIEGEQAPKADGHNNFSGDSELPPREFIPNKKKNQTFRREILQGIKEIAAEFEDGQEE